MRVNREIHHLHSQWQIHFSSRIKSHEEPTCESQGRTAILDLTNRPKWLQARILLSLFYLTTERSLVWGKDGNLFVNSCVCILEDKEAQEKVDEKRSPSKSIKRNGTDFERRTQNKRKIERLNNFYRIFGKKWKTKEEGNTLTLF